MESLLREIAHYVALIESVAILIIAIGTFEPVVAIVRSALLRHADNLEKRAVWLEHSLWLAAGLTFQLAADVVNYFVFHNLGRTRPSGGRCRNPHVPELFPRPRGRKHAQATTCDDLLLRFGNRRR